MGMVISLFTAALFAAVVITQTPDLDALRWNSRVILLFAPDTQNSQLAQQKEMFDREEAGIKDRDLKVFEITGRAPSNEHLRDQFHVRADSFAVVLIGKDGSKKFKHSEPTDPNDIFRLIDSMPMRKDEMRQRR